MVAAGYRIGDRDAVLGREFGDSNLIKTLLAFVDPPETVDCDSLRFEPRRNVSDLLFVDRTGIVDRLARSK